MQPQEPVRRRRKKSDDAPPLPAPIVHTIHPNNVYFADDLRRILRLRENTLRREIKKSRLRVARRSGRYIVLGKWVLEWIAAGELKTTQLTKSENASTTE